jgi:hypothetical protein
MTTVYKCIKGFTDRVGDRARIGQEFVLRKGYTVRGEIFLDRKSGRGSHIVIPTDEFNTYFQDVKKEEVVDDRLPIGTKVEVLVNKPDSADLKKGDIVEIMAYDGQSSYKLEGHWYVDKKYVKRATKPANFSIGSRVRVLVDEPNYADMKKDELGTIKGISNDTLDYTSYTVIADKDLGRKEVNWYIRQEHLEVIREEKKSELKFKVGDRVKIAKTSEYYDRGNDNPADVEGTVTETGRIGRISGATLDLKVKWDNGRNNSYNPEDLTPAVKKKEPEYYIFPESFNQVLTYGSSPLRVGKGLVPEKDRYQCLVVIDNEYEPIIEVAEDGRKMIKLVKK